MLSLDANAVVHIDESLSVEEIRAIERKLAGLSGGYGQRLPP